MPGRLDHLTEWPTVGRDEELAFIDDQIAAGGAGVLLTGETGTGKSRLARDSLSAAAASGHRTHMIVCTRAATAVPYAAFSSLTVKPGDGTERYHQLLAELRSRPQRTVLGVDDVDRLDRMSMAVVHQAVLEDLVFLVATVRTGLDRDPDVISLWKDLGLVRLEIQALSRAEVAAMVRAGLRGDVDGLAVKQIWSASAGVPLYVREQVVEGVTRCALTRERGVWVLSGALPTPTSIIDLVQVRLDGLDEDARNAAEMIAVAETLSAEILVSLTTPESVESLEGAGVIDASDGVCQLTHPLFGDVIRHTMPEVRLKRIMSDLADRIEVEGLETPEDLIRVATWRLESGAVSSPGILNSAAHAAYRAGDFVLARRLAEAAHEGGVTESSLLLGQILHEAGEHESAELINVGIDVSGADADTVERCLVQRAVNLFFGMGRGGQALGVLSDGPGGLASNRAWFLVNMSRIAEAAKTLESADTEQTPSRVTYAWIAALGGAPEKALLTLKELGSDGSGPGGARFRDFPDLPRAIALIEMGLLGDALDLCDRGHEASIDQHPTFIRSWWLFLLGRIYTDMGRMRAAASRFHQGAVLQGSMHQPGLMRWYLGASAYALAQTNDVAEVDALVAQCDEIGNRDERLFGFLPEAARIWRRARSSGRFPAAAALVSAGDHEGENGSIAAARRLWFDAVRLGGADLVGGRLADGDTQLDDMRARFASGLQDQDPETTTEAAVFFDEHGASLWAAEAWNAVATMWRRRGEQRRAAAAVRSADAARDRCEDVDTPGLITERVATPLSDREREVVSMAARGMPSKEIAGTLFISVRTVNNQIQRAYQKLGVSTRAEAAVALGVDTRD